MKIYLIAIFYLSINFCVGQNVDRVIIHTENCNDLIAGIDNYISIISKENTFLTEENISAFFISAINYSDKVEPVELKVEEKCGKFKIHPKGVGIVEFHIELKENQVVEVVEVKQLEAVCRLSNYKANSEVKISVGEFKAQLGLIANVECCGFDAKCKVLGFEIIRINSENISSRITNLGGKFEAASLDMIDQVESGDLYIFRNIYYQCPGTEKQRSEDMIFEIE